MSLLDKQNTPIDVTLDITKRFLAIIWEAVLEADSRGELVALADHPHPHHD